MEDAAVICLPDRESRAQAAALESFSSDELFALAHWNEERAGHYRLAAQQAEKDGDTELFDQARALSAWRELRGRIIHRQARRVERAERAIDEMMRDDAGQGLAEYALILAFVAVIALVALQLLGSGIGTLLSSVANQL